MKRTLTAAAAAACLFTGIAAAPATAVAPATTPATTPAEDATYAAIRQIGKPYVPGQPGPASFDAPGLVRYAWNKADVALPADLDTAGTPVADVADTKAGDLVFYGTAGHVAIALDKWQIVHADPVSGKVEAELMFASTVRAVRHIG
jgi:cell wall-associated NlpC family hydrolase